jgi:hypothetical protein
VHLAEDSRGSDGYRGTSPAGLVDALLRVEQSCNDLEGLRRAVTAALSSVATESGAEAIIFRTERWLAAEAADLRRRIGLSADDGWVTLYDPFACFALTVARSGLSEQGARQQPMPFRTVAGSPLPPIFGPHVQEQLSRRGWTEEMVEEILRDPAETVRTIDVRHVPDGTRLREPATGYVDATGHYVVQNDLTGDIVQRSNRHDPEWKAPWDDPAMRPEAAAAGGGLLGALGDLIGGEFFVPFLLPNPAAPVFRSSWSRTSEDFMT